LRTIDKVDVEESGTKNAGPGRLAHDEIWTRKRHPDGDTDFSQDRNLDGE
jgi:hypothetical protein